MRPIHIAERSRMNVVFLDYDGVVNTPFWEQQDDGKWICRFNWPLDNKVNDEQAVQWVSEFCEKNGYSIVVSSSWRTDDNYIECLRNAGLRDSVEIIGKTPSLPYDTRTDEILLWLKDHPETDAFLIFDDDEVDARLRDHLVKCRTGHGFKGPEMQAPEAMHNMLSNRERWRGSERSDNEQRP